MTHERIRGGEQERIHRVLVRRSAARQLFSLTALKAMWPRNEGDGKPYAVYRCTFDKERGSGQLHGWAVEGKQYTHGWYMVPKLRIPQGSDAAHDREIVIRGSARYMLAQGSDLELENGNEEAGLRWYMLDPPEDERQAYGPLAALAHGADVQLFQPDRFRSAHEGLKAIVDNSGWGGPFSHALLAEGAVALAAMRFEQLRDGA